MAPPSHIGKTKSDKVGDKLYAKFTFLLPVRRRVRVRQLEYRNYLKKVHRLSINVCKKDDAVPR